MESRVEQAVERFKKGCNCAQAVFVTYADRFGLDDTVKMMAEAFRAEHGSIRCGQLLGLEPGLPEGFRKKPCTEYVRTCAALVEKYLLG